MNVSAIRLQPPRRAKGFTLVEMMVTVIALAILTAAALPSFRSFITGMRIKNASFDVMAMLTLTRSEAIKRNILVRACPVNNDWTQGWTVSTSNACPPIGAPISRQNALAPNSVLITCRQGGFAVACNPIAYDPSGRAQVLTMLQLERVNALDSTEENSTRCISIDPSGRPNSRKGRC